MARSATGRELTDDQRTALYHRLLQLKKNGRVGSGDMKELMRTFNVSRQTVSRIWLRGCHTAAETGCAKVASKKRGRCGATRKHDGNSVRDVVTSKPSYRRSNFRSLAAATGIPKISLWNLLQANKLRRRTSRVKPMLSVKQKSDRFNYVQKLVRSGHVGWQDWTVPIVETKVTARRSKNCDRGTPGTVAMTVTKPIYRRLLVDKVIPAIQAKWPGRRGGTIYLQQDNARPHVAVDDAEVVAASRKNGWNIQLVAQPAMSPDFNVHDLGFFNAIQSLQHQTAVRTIGTEEV
ncbi:hypothetical protein H257_06204 [Aphanomyces astaci]|uniref:DUF7769 domain-containing protein n=1 Tax=Aphanomyces astaci TaxID=112090 RepID=W4GPA3_APHAT|nr:hypothetical protein H257_06204 [Aphanomyces astaci]ETV80703.1 hypothetical protein H257_06204 [Aphanomyces astaci]|eukprot:XP_009829650.1 hypothetical protein H257_06204 [Aphanomyces astaci]